MVYDYRVVPFRAGQTGQLSPTGIAAQLEHAIDQAAIDGFELYQVATVTVEVAPGCLGSLLGQQKQYLTYEQIILRRPLGAPLS